MPQRDHAIGVSLRLVLGGAGAITASAAPSHQPHGAPATLVRRAVLPAAA